MVAFSIAIASKGQLPMQALQSVQVDKSTTARLFSIFKEPKGQDWRQTEQPVHFSAIILNIYVSFQEYFFFERIPHSVSRTATPLSEGSLLPNGIANLL
jgi:hypothetical protein